MNCFGISAYCNLHDAFHLPLANCLQCFQAPVFVMITVLNVGMVSEFVFQIEKLVLLVLHQNRSLISCSLRKVYFNVQILVIFQSNQRL